MEHRRMPLSLSRSLSRSLSLQASHGEPLSVLIVWCTSLHNPGDPTAVHDDNTSPFPHWFRSSYMLRRPNWRETYHCGLAFCTNSICKQTLIDGRTTHTLPDYRRRDGTIPKNLEGDEVHCAVGGTGILPAPFTDDFGAFMSYFTMMPPKNLSASATLAGLTFAVKDIFDVEGHVTGFGCPDWKRSHEPAKRTAPVIQALLNAGATCIGKVHMDEMAYSILGQNVHYGTPANPVDRARMPGGSSSGSGVVVAANLVDFSLGTDTGGSVRVPASFCGILGFRPSHGGVSAVGVTPMAQSLDTVGWFARDVSILCKVGQVLLHTVAPQDPRPGKRFLIADDCFKMSTHPNDRRLSIISRSITTLYGDQALQHVNIGQHLASNVFSLKEFTETMGEGDEIGTLEVLDDVYSHLLRWEFKMNYEEWVTAEKPNLGHETAIRVNNAMSTTSRLMTLTLHVKEETRHAINELLKDDVVLVMPTVPGPPPILNAKGEAFERECASAFALLGVSSLSSCCQVSIPTGLIDSGAVSVSLLAKQGSDHLLLHTTLALFPTIQTETMVESATANDI